MGLAGRQAVGRAVIKVQHTMPGLVVEQEGRPGNGLTDWTGYRGRGLLTEWWRSGFRGVCPRGTLSFACLRRLWCGLLLSISGVKCIAWSGECRMSTV